MKNITLGAPSELVLPFWPESLEGDRIHPRGLGTEGVCEEEVGTPQPQ